LLKTFDYIMNLEFIKFFSFLSAKGLFTMIDHVKAKLKEAKLRLTKGDNSSAFRLAFEALDIFLRELCFKCGAPLESRPEKRSVSKWGFTKCVDFLRSNSIITKRQGSLLFKVNNLRVVTVHYGKDPDEKETKSSIREIERFIQGRGICAIAIMKNPVVGADLMDPLSKAQKLMLKHDFSQLPVFKGKKAVGSISEGTFVRLFPTLELASETTIDAVMDPPFKEISDNALLEEVRRLLITESAVLVTNQDQVIGIITKADLLKMF